MFSSKHRWLMPEFTDQQLTTIDELTSELGLSRLAIELLFRRGYTTRPAIHAFLNVERQPYHDPFLMKGMEQAVTRILQAVSAQENILVYGDYDADGVSSTTLMTYLLESMGATFSTFIPNRFSDGYGLNVKRVQEAIEDGVQLIITVDTGISAVEPVALAKAHGVDVIVTDHHEPPDQLPDAFTIVNPKQHDCTYPFSGLAGVGVAFKVAQAILGRAPLEWAPLVALGTIADLMPLIDENRLLVHHGIMKMRDNDHIGLRALAERSGMNLSSASSTDVGYRLAPRINAAGRMEDASLALALLCTSDAAEATGFAEQLEQLNRARQALVEEITADAIARFEQLAGTRGERSVIVLADVKWHVGVVGIVAARLLERYNKPVIILACDEHSGMAKGSARSIPGFDLYAALCESAPLLEKFGGHEAAAGLTVKVDNVEALEQSLHLFGEQVFTEGRDLRKPLRIDLSASLVQLSLHVVQQIEKCEPFGQANEAPLFHVQLAQLAEFAVIGKDHKHLKMIMRDELCELEVIGFGFASYASLLHQGMQLELVGKLTENEFQGKRKVVLQLVDLSAPQVSILDGRDKNNHWGWLTKCVQQQHIQLANTLVIVPNRLWEVAVREVFPDVRDVQLEHDELANELEYTHIVVLGRPWSEHIFTKLKNNCSSVKAMFLAYEGRDTMNHVIDRALVGRVYQTLMARTQRGDGIHLAEELYPLAQSVSVGSSTLMFILNVFVELEFAKLDGVHLHMNPKPLRRELSEAPSVLEWEARGSSAEANRTLSQPTAEFVNWISKL